MRHLYQLFSISGIFLTKIPFYHQPMKNEIAHEECGRLSGTVYDVILGDFNHMLLVLHVYDVNRSLY